MAPSGFRMRRHSVSQARENASYSAKLENLSHFVVDAVDARIVRPHQVVGELQIVRRVGEDEIDRMVGQLFESRDAITDDDAIGRGGRGRTTQNHVNATFATGEARAPASGHARRSVGILAVRQVRLGEAIYRLPMQDRVRPMAWRR